MNGVTKSSTATLSERRSNNKNAAPPPSTTVSDRRHLMVTKTASVWMNGVGMDDGLQICRYGGSAGEDFEIGASIIHFDVFDSCSSSGAKSSIVKEGDKKLSLDESLRLNCGSGGGISEMQSTTIFAATTPSNVNVNYNVAMPNHPPAIAAATFTATSAETESLRPRLEKLKTDFRSRQGIIDAIDSCFLQIPTSASASTVSFDSYGKLADGSSWMEHKEDCTLSADDHHSRSLYIPPPPSFTTDWNKCSFSARFLISTNRFQGGEEKSDWANLYHHGWLFKEHVQRDDFSAYLFPLIGTFDCFGAITPIPDSNGDLHDLYFRRQEQHIHKIDSFGTGMTREEYIQLLMDENGLDIETATSFAVPDNEYKFGKCNSHRLAINKREKFGKAFVVCADLTDKRAPRVIITFLLLLVDADLITQINRMERVLNECKSVSEICRSLAAVSKELSSAFDASNASLIQHTFNSICF